MAETADKIEQRKQMNKERVRKCPAKIKEGKVKSDAQKLKDKERKKEERNTILTRLQLVRKRSLAKLRQQRLHFSLLNQKN